MRAARFLAALFAVFMVHLLMVRLAPAVARTTDLFALLIVINALDGDLPAGMIGGFVAGFAADGLSGELYGLHGLAGTLTGYCSALVARHLIVQQLAVIGLLFAVATVFYEVLQAGLLRLLLPEPLAPDFVWVGIRAAMGAAIGVAVVAGWSTLRGRLSIWKRTRRRRVRMVR